MQITNTCLQNKEIIDLSHKKKKKDNKKTPNVKNQLFAAKCKLRSHQFEYLCCK